MHTGKKKPGRKLVRKRDDTGEAAPRTKKAKVAGPAFGSSGAGAAVLTPASAMPPPPRPSAPIAPREHVNLYSGSRLPVPILASTMSTPPLAVPTLASTTSTAPLAPNPVGLTSAAYREINNANANADLAVPAPAVGVGILGEVHNQHGRETSKETLASAPNSKLAAPNPDLAVQNPDLATPDLSAAPSTTTKAKKPRARSATPAPPGRSPYNLRRRRGRKIEDTNAGEGPASGV